MKDLELLASYLPSTIVREIIDSTKTHSGSKLTPRRSSYEAACLFADVSGFTTTSDTLAKKYGGYLGAEYLAKYLNSYFSQLVKIFASQGGDVFKFAGDGIIVLWVSNGSFRKIDEQNHDAGEEEEISPLEELTRRATQCAVQVARLGHVDFMPSELEEDELNALNVKMGIGVGNLSILHIGGVMQRVEYLAFGEPMIQAFAAEKVAHPGEVVLSAPAWGFVSNYFKCSEAAKENKNRSGRVVDTDGMGFFKLDIEHKINQRHILRKKNTNWLLSGGNNNIMDSCTPLQQRSLRKYVPGAIQRSIDPDNPEYELWISDRRLVTVLFVNFGLKNHDIIAAAEYEEALQKIHAIMVTTQTCIYRYEGAVNKFLVDDKGATLIAVFGLPPLSHENDPLRAVSCALELQESLAKRLRLKISVGIGTGLAFCGVLGSTIRKEYSVLGSSVNLAARLMQFASACQTRTNAENMKNILKRANKGLVLCDEKTYQKTCMHISYTKLDKKIHLKGKERSVQAYQPLHSSVGTDKYMFKLGESGFLNIGSTLASQITSRVPHNHKLVAVTHRVLNAQHSFKESHSKSNEISTPYRVHRQFDNISIWVSPRVLECKGGTSKQTLLRRTNSHKSVKNDVEFSSKYGTEIRKQKVRMSKLRSSSSHVLLLKEQNKKMETDTFNSCGKANSPAEIERVKKVIESTKSRNTVINPMYLKELKQQTCASKSQEHSRSKFEGDTSSPKTGNSSRRRNIVNEVALQATVGIKNISLGSISRDSLLTLDRGSDSPFRVLLKKSLSFLTVKGLLQRDSRNSVKDVALMIEGTEFRLPVDDHDIPLNYLELIVTEAVSNGERGYSDPICCDMRKQSYCYKNQCTGVENPRSRAGSGTTVNLVLVPKEDMRYLQSSHARTRQILIERKIRLLETGKGSVTVVTGDAGVGKTTILKRFTASVLPMSMPVYCSAGLCTRNYLSHERTKKENACKNSYKNGYPESSCHCNNSNIRLESTLKPESREFAVWLEVLRQWLRMKSSENSEAFSMKKFILDILPLELKPFIGLLNKDLNLECKLKKMYADIINQSIQKHNQYMEEILVELLKAMILDKGAALILIDDGLNVTPTSWQLMLKLASLIETEGLPLMIVIGTRPMEANIGCPIELTPYHTIGALTNSLHTFRELCKVSIVEVVRITGLLEYEARCLFYESLSTNQRRVIGVTEELWSLCEERCHRNPLLIQELSQQLRTLEAPGGQVGIIRYAEVSFKAHTIHDCEPKIDFSKSTTSRSCIAGLSAEVRPLNGPGFLCSDDVQDISNLYIGADKKGRAHSSFEVQMLKRKNMRDKRDRKSKSEVYSDGFMQSLFLNSSSHRPKITLAPPDSVKARIGAKIDRLSPMEQLITKVGSVIGDRFTLRQIEELYPIQATIVIKELKYACENLVNQHGLLCKSSNNEGLLKDEYSYEFNDEFTGAVVRDRLLSKQLSALLHKLEKFNGRNKTADKRKIDDKERTNTEDSILETKEGDGPDSPCEQTLNTKSSHVADVQSLKNTANDSNKVVHQGGVLIKKTSGIVHSKRKFSSHLSEWKVRHVLLFEDSLRIYRKLGNKKTDFSSLSQLPNEIWYLNSQCVCCSNYDTFLSIVKSKSREKHKKENANISDPMDLSIFQSDQFKSLSKKHSDRLVLLLTTLWSKRGSMHQDVKIFTMLAPNKEMADDWINKINQCIEKCQNSDRMVEKSDMALFDESQYQVGIRRRESLLDWSRGLQDTDIDPSLFTSTSAISVRLTGLRISDSAAQTIGKAITRIYGNVIAASAKIFATISLKQSSNQLLFRYQTSPVRLNPIGPTIISNPDQWRDAISFPVNADLVTDWTCRDDPQRSAYLEISFWLKRLGPCSTDEHICYLAKTMHSIVDEELTTKCKGDDKANDYDSRNNGGWSTISFPLEISPSCSLFTDLRDNFYEGGQTKLSTFTQDNIKDLDEKANLMTFNMKVKALISSSDLEIKARLENPGSVDGTNPKNLIRADPRLLLYNCFTQAERKRKLEDFRLCPRTQGGRVSVSSHKSNASDNERTSTTTRTRSRPSLSKQRTRSYQSSSSFLTVDNKRLVMGTLSRIDSLIDALTDFKLEKHGAGYNPKAGCEDREIILPELNEEIDEIVSDKDYDEDSSCIPSESMATWILEELNNVKRMLLLNDFSLPGDELGLDENQRKWLGQQFTRESEFHYDFASPPTTDINSLSASGSSNAVAVPAGDGRKVSRRGRASSQVERFTSAYLQSSAANLVYQDPESGLLKGPFPISFFMLRLSSGEFDSTLNVKMKNSNEFTTLSQAVNELRIQAELYMKNNMATSNSASQARKNSDNGSESWLPLKTEYHQLTKSLASDDEGIANRGNDFRSWEFDLMLLPDKMKFYMVATIFMSFNLQNRFNIHIECFSQFMLEVENSMKVHNVDYHNFDHACDVLQTTYVFLSTMKGARLLDSVDIFALFTASICHDLEHPGLNNAFQIKSASNLAILYNDRSVLENHHCARAFQIMRHQRSDILKNLPEHERNDFRKIMVEAILSTDMTYHFSLYQEASDLLFTYPGISSGLYNRQAQGQDGPAVGAGGAFENSGLGNVGITINAGDLASNGLCGGERLTIVKVFLHCADISNPCKPWKVSKLWADKLLKEFFVQGDAEKMQGWISSPNMDRESTKQEEMSLNFIDYIVAPMFVCLHRFIPHSIDACRCLIENRQKWQDILDQRLHLQNEQEKRNKNRALSSQRRIASNNEPEARTPSISSPTKSISEVYEQWQVRKAAFEKTVAQEFDNNTIDHKDPITNRRLSSPKPRLSRAQTDVIAEDRHADLLQPVINAAQSNEDTRTSLQNTSGIFTLQSFVSAQMDMSSSGAIVGKSSQTMGQKYGSFRFISRKLSNRFL